MKAELQDRIYVDTMQQLLMMIIAANGSVAAFCQQHDMDRANLSKIFNHHQDMSINLFLRCCVALEILPASVVPTTHTYGQSLSLREYLHIDNNAVLQAVLELNFS